MNHMKQIHCLFAVVAAIALGEKNNIATANPERSAQMHQQMMERLKAVGGYFPKPNPHADPHAKVYDPSNLSDMGDGSDPEAGNK